MAEPRVGRSCIRRQKVVVRTSRITGSLLVGRGEGEGAAGGDDVVDQGRDLELAKGAQGAGLGGPEEDVRGRADGVVEADIDVHEAAGAGAGSVEGDDARELSQGLGNQDSGHDGVAREVAL